MPKRGSEEKSEAAIAKLREGGHNMEAGGREKWVERAVEGEIEYQLT